MGEWFMRLCPLSLLCSTVKSEINGVESDFVVMKDVKQEYINQGSDCERVLILIEDATDTDGCKSDRKPPSQRSLLGITFKH